MSAFAFFLLCIQACLLQNAFGALGPMGYGLAGPYGTGFPGAYCGYGFAGIGPYGAGIAGMAGPYGFPGPFTGIGLTDAIEPFGCSGYAAYGGAGVGNCAIAGELPVGGATNVAGQVPIIGAVEYGGVVPAIGTVSIAGKCACGCGGSYY